MTDQLSFFNSPESHDLNAALGSEKEQVINAEGLKRFSLQHPLVYSLMQSLTATMDSTEDRHYCRLTLMTLGHALNQGHVCINIAAYAKQKSVLEYGIDSALPELLAWQDWLQKQSFVNAEDQSQAVDCTMDHWDVCRLELGFLYFSKWADWEARLAVQLQKRSQLTCEADITQLECEKRLNWQDVAVANSLLSPLSIVVGGPGTGKTTTVARILAAVLNHEGHAHYNMVLAAPTGKAAARMAMALNEKMQQMSLCDELAARVPKNALTLHRLLAWSQERRQYRYNANHKLIIDCIVVDEASMIDMAMFTTLLEALPDSCRVIILGDPYQLASVSAGSVLSDICVPGILNHFSQQRVDQLKSLFADLDVNASKLALMDNCVMLQRSYRFDDDAGIGMLARAVLNANEEALLKALQEVEVSFYKKSELELQQDPIKDLLVKQYKQIITLECIKEAFNHLSQFQLLCAVKEGDYSTAFYNQAMLQIVQKSAVEFGRDENLETVMSTVIYHGMPIMMEENHHKLGIYNGDMGLVWRENGRLRLYFHCGGAEIKSFLPSQIQGWAVAHAITVHKSQGSEYDEVAFVSPPLDSPLLNKEMLYTAITRSKSHFYCLAEIEELKLAMHSPCQRVSALPQRLAMGVSS